MFYLENQLRKVLLLCILFPFQVNCGLFPKCVCMEASKCILGIFHAQLTVFSLAFLQNFVTMSTSHTQSISPNPNQSNLLYQDYISCCCYAQGNISEHYSSHCFLPTLCNSVNCSLWKWDSPKMVA